MRLDGVDPFDLNGPSFSALLRRIAPDMPLGGAGAVDHVDGTTVLAVTYAGGVVMAGDRRATAGNIISKRDMRKVFEADSWSAVAISGAAGPAMELAKIFATELEHYEKVEGFPLSLEGKANKLAQHGPPEPAHGDAGPGRRPAVRRLRSPSVDRPDLRVRRRRRPLRGAPVRGPGFRRP
jgi:hypothetical protein